MQLMVKYSELENDFYDIFGKTDAFGVSYSKQDVDSWISEFVEDHRRMKSEIIIIN